MPKLPSLKPRAIIRALEKSGFEVVRIKGSHHLMRHPGSGKRVIIAVHNKEMRPSTLAKIIKDSGLSEEEFLDHV